MKQIIFWKSSNPSIKHTLTLTRSANKPGGFIHNLRAGGWRVKVVGNDTESDGAE